MPDINEHERVKARSKDLLQKARDAAQRPRLSPSSDSTIDPFLAEVRR